MKFSDSIYSVSTKNGPLSKSSASDAKILYVVSGSTGNLYAVTRSGDREKLLTNVIRPSIASGRVFYIDREARLYTAKLSGTEIDEKAKISSDVASFAVTPNGKYVYLFRDASTKSGTLYAYKVSDEKPVKVASDVYASFSSNGVAFSADGKTVYFVTDVQKDSGNSYYGDLYKWSFSGSKRTKIASDVTVGSCSSFLLDNTLNRSFFYTRSDSLGGEPVYDMYYYNGRNSQKIGAGFHR